MRRSAARAHAIVAKKLKIGGIMLIAGMLAVLQARKISAC